MPKDIEQLIISMLEEMKDDNKKAHVQLFLLLGEVNDWKTKYNRTIEYFDNNALIIKGMVETFSEKQEDRKLIKQTGLSNFISTAVSAMAGGVMTLLGWIFIDRIK